MDIAALATSLSQASLMNNVSVAVLDKTMEMNTESGESLIRMMDRSMELSVNPHIGSGIDVFV